MGTFSPGDMVRRMLGRCPGTETDYLLDQRIRAALLEEARVRPPAGAWERLRQAVVERKCKRRQYGMWVLDEPQRDPPESPPMLLSGRQYERALRIYDVQWRVSGMNMPVYKDAMWGGVMPTFSALINW